MHVEWMFGVWSLDEGELLEGSAHFIGTMRNAIQILKPIGLGNEYFKCYTN